MRRYYAAAILAVSVAAGCLVQSAAAYMNPLPKRPATIAVERLSKSVPVTDMAVVKITRPNGLGTGFHIGGGRIVTAAHVISGAKTVSLKMEDGRITSARVVVVDEKNDVAILQSPHKAMLAAELNCGSVPIGTAVVSVGHPMGLEFVTVYGTIAGKPQEVGGRQAYITDMTTIMGQSGSAVWADGRVIGVTSSVMIAPLELIGNVPPDAGVYSRSIVGFGFVVPSSVVCEMVAAVSEGGAV